MSAALRSAMTLPRFLIEWTSVAAHEALGVDPHGVENTVEILPRASQPPFDREIEARDSNGSERASLVLVDVTLDEGSFDRDAEVVTSQQVAFLEGGFVADDCLAACDLLAPSLNPPARRSETHSDRRDGGAFAGNCLDEIADRLGELPITQEQRVPLIGEVTEERACRQSSRRGYLGHGRVRKPVLFEQVHRGRFQPQGGIR